VFVEQSGYDENAESAAPPSPSVYQQILDKLDEIETSFAEIREYIDEKVANIDGGQFTDWQNGE